LIEEFEETLGVSLEPDQYTFQPTGFVIEDNPVPTDNANVYGQSTVRLYRIFEVEIVDVALFTTMLSAGEHYSVCQVLGVLAIAALTAAA
jgi:hypothetical protein